MSGNACVNGGCVLSNKPNISDAEWQVMHVIWERQPVTAQAIIAALDEQVDWSGATIKTMLHRLVKKKVLRYQREGNRYLYRARVERSESLRQESQSFLDRVFGGEAAPLLAHFVQSGDLTEAEIETLRKLLEQAGGDS